MSKRTRYSFAERQAYNMGVGVAKAGINMHGNVAKKLTAGMSADCKKSALNGYFDSLKKR